MKLVRDLERRLEQLVDGLAGRVFPGRLHPTELLSRLLRELDLSSASVDGEILAANVYRLRFHPEDLADTPYPAEILSQLEAGVTAGAAERGWNLAGDVSVQVISDANVKTGLLEIDVGRMSTPLAAWARLRAKKSLDVRKNRSVIGRSADSAVVLEQETVSRTHALLWREAGRVWVQDLGSANGTTCDGLASGGAPLEVQSGSVLTFGAASYVFELI